MSSDSENDRNDSSNESNSNNESKLVNKNNDLYSDFNVFRVNLFIGNHSIILYEKIRNNKSDKHIYWYTCKHWYDYKETISNDKWIKTDKENIVMN